MTIISILIAFTLCHFVREFGRFRQQAWLNNWVNFANSTFAEVPGWKGFGGFLVIILAPIAVLVLLYAIFDHVLGPAGVFLLALAVLIYTFGPRDLDTDVAAIVKAEEEEEQKAAIKHLLGGDPPDDEDECKAAMIDAVFSESLRRWFAIIFWFAASYSSSAAVPNQLGYLAKHPLRRRAAQPDPLPHPRPLDRG